jgi:outer membrane protein OmpA-like peptidoglycan-associated protein
MWSHHRATARSGVRAGSLALGLFVSTALVGVPVAALAQAPPATGGQSADPKKQQKKHQKQNPPGNNRVAPRQGNGAAQHPAPRHQPKTVTPHRVAPPPGRPTTTTVVPRAAPPPPRPTYTAPVQPRRTPPAVATPPNGRFLPPPGVKSQTVSPATSGTPPIGRVIPPGGRGAPNATVGGAPVPKRIEDVRRARVQVKGPAGQTFINEPGNRTIVKQGNRTIITRNETSTIQRFVPGAQTRRRPDGIRETVYVSRDGSRVFTEVDASGRLVRRYRRDARGREVVFIDNRRFLRNLAIGAGAAIVIGALVVSLPRPAIAIPRQQYIVDYAHASDEDLYLALSAPPIEILDRRYSLDEIRYSYSLRERLRSIDLDTITFDFGSFEVPIDQYGRLERVARVIGRIIDRDNSEMLLLEGHTDAVGSAEDNLSLSDRRAEAVAAILVQQFGIPPENLVTQGYGEQFLKIPTSGPERANRRVSVRRITPMLSRN